jgi:hypothetical protein
MPAYTAGFLAPVPFLYAAATLRARKLWLIAAAYCAVWVVPWILLAVVNADNHAVDVLSHRLTLALAIGGTVHAFVLRGSLPRISGTQSRTVGPQPPQAPVAAPATDPTQTMCAQVRAALSPLKYSAMTHAELFPPACKQLLDETIAQVEQVVAFAAAGCHADAELRAVHAIVTDYLPTSINTYVRLPHEYAQSHRNAGGRTAGEELELELWLLRGKAKEAVDSLHRGDAQRLEEHSAFLMAKFGKSELDLP